MYSQIPYLCSMENNSKSYPTSVYAEMTPNPATLKFVSNRLLIENHAVAEFFSKAEANGYSALAEQLFDFPFVKSVFVAANFVTVSKNDSVSWDFITMELREFISDFLRKNEFAVSVVPPVKKQAEKQESALEEAPADLSEIDKQIIELLDEYVRPAVERDGGAIHFRSFNEGTVSVVLKGSCSGCPSSQATLKQGIEILLKKMVPEVTEVVAVAG
jgi:Fe-S cluster biogenesis protein NfuA